MDYKSDTEKLFLDIFKKCTFYAGTWDVISRCYVKLTLFGRRMNFPIKIMLNYFS